MAGGGTARTDALSLLYLRPAAVITAWWFLLILTKQNLTTIRRPLILFVLFAIAIGWQLLPIPPGLWVQLPGRNQFSLVTEVSPNWRPASIAPDQTLNSLVSLVVPFAALLITIWIKQYRHVALVILITAGLTSGAVAVMQLSAGPASSFYTYRITNDGAAVGLFSNRNHQAIMIACLLPMLALWLTTAPRPDGRRDIIAIAAGCLVIALIFITGSRSGLAAGAIGLLTAFIIHDRGMHDIGMQRRKRYRLTYIAVFVLAALIGGVLVMLTRAVAIQRFVGLDVDKDVRVTDFGLFIDLIRRYFPIGAGAGTFDPAFRIAEPSSIVTLEYLNHAHNEFVELAITCGLPGCLVLAAFIVWYMISLAKLVRMPNRQRDGYAMLGASLISILMLASLSDYPLRTPALASLFAVASAWLSMGMVGGKAARISDPADPADHRDTSHAIG